MILNKVNNNKYGLGSAAIDVDVVDLARYLHFESLCFVPLSRNPSGGDYDDKLNKSSNNKLLLLLQELAVVTTEPPKGAWKVNLLSISIHCQRR